MSALSDYFLQNHDTFFYVLASISLILDITMMGLSGPLLFFSIACALTGLLISMGVLSSWEIEAFSVGMLSLVTAFILWKPLKRFQGPAHVSDGSSDMIGQIVSVSEEITHQGGSVRHSGINWQARLDDDSNLASVASGIRVKIASVQGNVLIVIGLPPKAS